ncbi:MAG: alcohol dehydrogenase catalytic domain-containing protein [Candidatus Omnitrophota bacterium]
MKALRYTPAGLQLDANAPLPIPARGETLVKTRLAGICRTDLELTKGYMGFHGILGHEFVGELAEDGEIGAAGTRVVGEINAGCGECPACRQDMERHCPHRTVLGILGRDGCMAEYLTLPNRNLLAIPDNLSDEDAVFSEPLAAALEIFEQWHIQPTHRVCILGDGKLGLLIALAAAHRHEGDLLLIGHHEENLAIVNDRMRTVMEQQLDAAEYKRWDFAIEATGRSSGFALAMKLAKPRGVIVLKSTMAQSEALDLTPLVIDEIAVTGSRCGRLQPAIHLLARGVLPISRLVEAVYPLKEAEAAWKRASQAGAKKVMLRMMNDE